MAATLTRCSHSKPSSSPASPASPSQALHGFSQTFLAHSPTTGELRAGESPPTLPCSSQAVQALKSLPALPPCACPAPASLDSFPARGGTRDTPTSPGHTAASECLGGHCRDITHPHRALHGPFHCPKSKSKRWHPPGTPEGPSPAGSTGDVLASQRCPQPGHGHFPLPGAWRLLPKLLTPLPRDRSWGKPQPCLPALLILSAPTLNGLSLTSLMDGVPWQESTPHSAFPEPHSSPGQSLYPKHTGTSVGWQPPNPQCQPRARCA